MKPKLFLENRYNLIVQKILLKLDLTFWLSLDLPALFYSYCIIYILP